MAGDSKSSRGNKRIIRGLYYSSKWVRDLQNSPKLRKFFEQIAGEELVPHPSFSNSPQVNHFYPLNAVFIYHFICSFLHCLQSNVMYFLHSGQHQLCRRHQRTSWSLALVSTIIILRIVLLRRHNHMWEYNHHIIYQ